MRKNIVRQKAECVVYTEMKEIFVIPYELIQLV